MLLQQRLYYITSLQAHDLGHILHRFVHHAVAVLLLFSTLLRVLLQQVGAVGHALVVGLHGLHKDVYKRQVQWYPRDYEDRRKIWPIRRAPEEGSVCICALVATAPRTNYIRKGLSITHVTAFDDTGSMNLTFFNQPYSCLLYTSRCV